MTVVYSDEQIIAEVPGLDRALLLRFVEARIVIPVERPAEPARGYLPVDVARLRLACELCESFDFDDDALGVVMGLVDRLHTTRAELRALLEAVDDLPKAQRLKVAEGLRDRLSNRRR
jgi:chaperone modulatory protein CbpM